jgi:hypothetical protein
MKIETLKELIEIEFRRCQTISQFKSEVFRLLDVFENDFEPIQITIPTESEIDKLTKKLKQDVWASK